MSAPRNRTHALLCLLGLAGAAAVYAVWPARPPDPPPTPPGEAPPVRTFPAPQFTPSDFLNSGPDSRHVGSAACAKCHEANHKSYSLTAHSKALSDVDPAAEPPDGEFDHKASGRSYRVYRKDGQLRHEEVIRTEDGKAVARVDLPVRYLVGSGHFSRTYVVEADGFLHESPITWYASTKRWDLSPGYDRPNHSSFERPVQMVCLRCHVGRAEPTGGSAHKIAFHEKAIGCENCHGPGSLHQEFHRTHKLAPGEPDRTIVHPGRLPRPLLESVCASCHMTGLTSVLVRGRRHGEFLPGRPLSDYQINFRFDTGREEMTVVGHVEQLRQSACYKKSELTCVTCHDPHAREKPKDPIAFYRRKCLDCHETKPCGLSPDRRLKENPADDCAACHMPRGGTEIPHIAFHHHRIGRHSPAQHPAPPARVPDLVPIDENPHLDTLERLRNLGLAYLQAIHQDRAAAPFARTYHDRAREHLTAVYQAGLRDGDTLLALAELHAAQRDDAATDYTREALGLTDLAAETRAHLLQSLARSELAGPDARGAAVRLEEAVRLRRLADDWELLGASYLKLNQPDKALPAMRQAVAIRPSRPTPHLGLAECYRRLGERARGDEHLGKARWLKDHRQD